jgi:hypothetical protein
VNLNSAADDDYQDLPKVLDWVSTINYKIIQNDRFSKHMSGTGTWFTKHAKFQDWLSGIIPVLLARGPRKHLTCHYSLIVELSGQRVLGRRFFREFLPPYHYFVRHSFLFRSIVVRHLQTSFSNNRDIAIIYAYCQYADPHPPHPITDVLSSLVKQLAESHSRVHSSVVPVCRNHITDGTRPIEQDWLKLLQTLVPLFSRVYIIIDALDEFPNNDRDGLLHALISLKASLLISSRPSIAFDLLRHVELIDIGNENGRDIEFFIDQRFRESSNLSSLVREKESVRSEINAKLKEISKNMYVAYFLS